MGAISTITLADGETTPVNHDFVPVRVDGDIASYLEKSNSAAIGWWPMQISLRAPVRSRNGASVYRCGLKLTIPVVQTETINGVDVPSVTRTLRANVELVLPTASTTQERDNLVTLVQNALGHAAFRDVAESLNNVY